MKIIKTLPYLAMVAFGILVSCSQGNHADTIKTTDFGVLDSDTVSVEVAKAYVKNFGNHKQNDSTMDIAGKRHPNTRCIWFSLKRLRTLIAKIDSGKGDGIRFYLATYDSTYKKGFPNTPPVYYWNHNTLLMVSTYKDKADTTIHRDFYNNGPPTGNGGTNHGIIIMANPENRGELCPPPNPCTGATLLSN
jgi:hypothetical protein